MVRYKGYDIVKNDTGTGYHIKNEQGWAHFVTGDTSNIIKEKKLKDTKQWIDNGMSVPEWMKGYVEFIPLKDS